MRNSNPPKLSVLTQSIQNTINSEENNARASIANETLSTWAFLGDIAKNAKEYFLESESKERNWALLLLACVVAGTIASVLLNSILIAGAISMCFTALAQGSLPLYIKGLEMFLVAAVSYGALAWFNSLCKTTLQNRWRKWLTEKYNQELDIQKINRLGITDVAQRLQDVKDYIEYTISLSMGLMEALLTLPIAMSTLWILGGAVNLVVLGVNIIIPGYMVWLAILYTILSTVLAYSMSSTLKALLNKQESIEADFRATGDFLNKNIDEIALEHKEELFKEILNEKTQAIYNNSNKIRNVYARVTGVTTFLTQLAFVISDALAAPQYFAGVISLGQLSQISFAFSQVQYSLSWPLYQLESIIDYRTKADRIAVLKNAMADNRFEALEKIKTIKRNDNDKNIHIDINIMEYPNISESREFKYPGGNIMKGLKLSLEPGQHVLIQAENGTGKSVLKQVLAESYKAGNGIVSRPEGDKILCLSQDTLSIPGVTLRQYLNEHQCNYNDEQYQSIFETTRIESSLIEKLDNNMAGLTLSKGVRQKLAFAKILLNSDLAPDWLILDEATSGMDQATPLMYQLLKSRLRNTTIISIAHGHEFKQYHDRIITLKLHKDESGQNDRSQNVEIIDDKNLLEALIAASNRNSFFLEARDDIFGDANPVYFRRPSIG